MYLSFTFILQAPLSGEGGGGVLPHRIYRNRQVAVDRTRKNHLLNLQDYIAACSLWLKNSRLPGPRVDHPVVEPTGQTWPIGSPEYSSDSSQVTSSDPSEFQSPPYRVSSCSFWLWRLITLYPPASDSVTRIPTLLLTSKEPPSAGFILIFFRRICTPSTGYRKTYGSFALPCCDSYGWSFLSLFSIHQGYCLIYCGVSPLIGRVILNYLYLRPKYEHCSCLIDL